MDIMMMSVVLLQAPINSWTDGEVWTVRVQEGDL